MTGWIRVLALWVVLALPLSADYVESVPVHWTALEQVRAHLLVGLHSIRTQRLEIVFLAGCVAAFTLWRRPGRTPAQRSFDTPRPIWGIADLKALLFAGFYAAVLAPTLFRPGGVASTDPVELACGLALGRGLVCLARSQRSPQQAVKLYGEVLNSLVCLLALSVLVEPGWSRVFLYRGQRRWEGPWSNPNHFGLLMATGIALAAGQAWGRWRARRATPLQGKPGAVAGWFGFYGVSCALMAAGLARSYSRGAWLGALVGLVCLARGPLSGRAGEPQRNLLRWPAWARGSRIALTVSLVSLGVLAFWGLRQSEIRTLRRALSPANVNDFSWRNRLVAYEGSLQILAARPWLGFGWGRHYAVFERLFMPSSLTQASAVQSNDFLAVGVTLGIPALFCLVGYVLLSLLPAGAWTGRRRPGFGAPRDPVAERVGALRAICRAGALVLLVGFWFDYGLFCLPLTAPFWVLLELGAADLGPLQKPAEDSEARNEGPNRLAATHP